VKYYPGDLLDFDPKVDWALKESVDGHDSGADVLLEPNQYGPYLEKVLTFNDHILYIGPTSGRYIRVLTKYGIVWVEKIGFRPLKFNYESS